uniref:Integrase catalytic domain-containing protein n=1 Tax=Amphimedon queenslandica TaxID=400682 RepID=A0A1X7T112_AMPQE
MKQLNIKHHLITPYHPQANGLHERFSLTFQRMLAKYSSGKSKDAWDECIDLRVFAYNMPDMSLPYTVHLK